MKSYVDHINDFSYDDILEGLLGYGLFPNKIPPFLCSKSFYTFSISNYASFNKKNSYGYVNYENMRNINVPRNLSIPHPIAHSNLCNFISQNWDKIQQYFDEKTSNQNHKISRVHLRKMFEKNKLFEMNYKNFDEDGFPENDLLINSHFIAKADISNCYPSIYSHSVPWALIGKKEAKLKSGNSYKREWFNKFDFYLRNTKKSETNGILIGPHTSNLISEIILVAVDYKMYKKGYKYIRHIDDYTCYTETFDKAEQFFIDLAEQLKVFELSLNHKKSNISKLPFALSETWIRKLNAFHFPNIKTKDGKLVLKIKELRSFLDLTLDLVKTEKENSAILSYAIRIISSKELGEKAKEFYFKRLHHLIFIYPYLIQYLDEFVLEKFTFNKNQIKDLLNDIMKYGVTKNLPELCSYSLFLSLKHDIELDNLFKEEILDREDCITMLLSYLYAKRNNKRLKKYIKKAKQLNTIDFDSHWLFIYEVLKHTNLSDEFVKMKKDKISFIADSFKKLCEPKSSGCLNPIKISK